ncbi:MAG: Type IV pilus biogenesis protein PilQ [Nitrospira sp.]|jgi:type IV pilus assembly protein PilQ|nr:MAG: Type IV pilus biogenesis protein PilQ [Nitrospira sp.]
MKPLFLHAGNCRTVGCFIEALGLSLTALTILAQTPALAREIGMTNQSDAASARVLGQAVTTIEIHPETERVTVVVAGDGQLFPEANFLDESRLIVDIPAVSSTLRRSVIRADHYLLKKIRVGHHADKVRLVFDVSERPIFSLARDENKVLITLKPNEHKVPPVGPAQFDGEKERVLFTPRTHKVLFEPGNRVTRRVARMATPGRSQFRVQRVQMAGESASVEKDDRSDDLIVGQSRFVGRRISLDFQQADITNILRLIAEVSGFNIVVGEGVKSKVTMKLVSVPWDQALDMLLKMNGLGMIRQGSIVWVDSLANIAKQQDEEARAKDAKTKAEELVDRVFYIRNLQAQELMQSLRQNLSPRGLMQFNAGSNALVVRETESKLAVIKQLVDGLDLQVPQVQIEARIVQADTVYARGLGIQWGFQAGNQTPTDFFSVTDLTGPFGQLAGTGANTLTRNFLVNLPAQVGGLPAVPSIGWTFGKLGGDFALDMRLSAGELLGLSKVIAAPKITTLDKREAKISQGESIPFQTTSLQGTQTTFVDANLELNVTPQITSRDPNEEGKRILMRVRATRNAVGARSNPAGPSIDRREATTQVIVRDGETMVIGGVFVDTQANNVQGVPYLSRMPVLGWLFKNKSESVSKQELLIFLTPSIIKT